MFMASLPVSIRRSSTKHNRNGVLTRRRQRIGLFFVLPSVLFVSLFFVAPLFMTVWMSLHDWPLFGTIRFIGLDNYRRLLSDTVFLNSLVFTTKYTLIVTPVTFVLAFALALLVRQRVAGVALFRTAYFLPAVIGVSTAAFLWVWLFNDQVGVLNSILRALHLIQKPVAWLNEPGGAFLAVIVMVVWKSVGATMLLLLLGLQAIPDEFFEAARVDGAGRWQQLVHVTLPLMRRPFALALILTVIGSYLAFDQFYVMTRGGPVNQTITVVYWIFTNSFVYFRLGYSASLSVVLLLILLVMSIVQLYFLRDDS